MIRELDNVALITDFYRKLGVSDMTIDNGKHKYGGIGRPEIRRLHQLEEENAKLKRLVADLMLNKVTLQDVLSKKW